MKIASFNVWNSDRGMPLREQQIVDELKNIDADVLCLQEVPEALYNKLTSELSAYPHNYYYVHEIGESELAIFSKHKIISNKHTPFAVYAICEMENGTHLVTNVHLPWESILQKEQLILEIVKEIDNTQADYKILTGDFNCGDDSSVHRFLTGEQSLLGCETNPTWEDLAEIHSEIEKTPVEVTLDIRNNPRWAGKNCAYTSCRFDRIYIIDPFPKPALEFIGFSLFGKEKSEVSGYCASDHYGVFAEFN